jgi:hypothetical protein
VSHGKIRTEKICLNCGTETPGRYCPACGQENIEPKQTAWHLISHFFSDITHFDGKFFITVKDLFAKPGFLTREYMMGRRASYLDPIRMYIFTSAIFFLILLSVFNARNLKIGDEFKSKIRDDEDLRELLPHAKTGKDSLGILKAYDSTVGRYAKLNKDSSHKLNVNVNLQKGDYPSIATYDSAQKALPANQRDGWMKRKINTRKIELTLRYQKEGGGLIREMINDNMHNWPKILFISLPLFALLLKLLYIRHKQFYYVDHGIFSVHLWIFSFLLLLIFFGVNYLHNRTGWAWLDWLNFFIFLYPLFYYYKAMRRFYGQSRGKTLLKHFLLFILSFFLFLSIFLAGIIFTVFET